MTQEAIEPVVGRREFLKAAAVTAVGATAVGTGAAFLLGKNQPTSVALNAPPVPESIQIAANTGQEVSELLARLARTQAENLRLKAELAATQGQLEAAQAVAGQGSVAAEALQAQLDEANTQVNQLSDQVGVLGGLVTLYEQLESVDLEALASGALSAVGDSFTALLDQLPTVADGLQVGQQALDDLEEQIPLLEHGRGWLLAQIERVSARYEAIETAVSKAVESTGPFLSRLSNWVQDILGWLPFGIGDKAAEIFEAIIGLLAHTPDMIGGLQANLAQPLDMWLEPEGEKTRLHKRLIKPVRDQALGPAAEAIDQAGKVHAIFQMELADPLQVAAERQDHIRRLVAEYRAEHRL